VGTAIGMAFDGATLAACPLSALVLSFAFYGFCGWAWESTVCAMLNHGRFANSGFLLGPCCPIYGAGGIACWLLLRGIPDAPSQFVAAALVCSVIEYSVGVLLEKTTGARFWDYSHLPFNLHGRICLYWACAFGLGALCICRLVEPALLGLLGHLPVLIVRLSAFILPEIQNITAKDDMELEKMGERKQAVFAIIPDNDGTFNYIVGMLYTCAFQSLYYQADKVHQGALPVPVRMMMDEFCNVSLPDDFGKLQATMRSRNIMSTIVLQNISALKALFKDDWEGLIGNADTLLYLGGNEVSTFKYISELLGKETLDTRTRSVSKGRSGSSSVNYQQTGRELMTPDEVRALDNDRCILFIRGELPVLDRKYDILKHPALKLTEDGGAAPYIHHPGLTYALEDFPLPADSWESIEIIE
jgi:hypothetical protein